MSAAAGSIVDRNTNVRMYSDLAKNAHRLPATIACPPGFAVRAWRD
jgi:hypothetical protein